jgi:hypothetical protein
MGWFGWRPCYAAGPLPMHSRCSRSTRRLSSPCSALRYCIMAAAQASPMERGGSLPVRPAPTRRPGENAAAQRGAGAGAPLPAGARRLSTSGSGGGRWV